MNDNEKMVVLLAETYGAAYTSNFYGDKSLWVLKFNSGTLDCKIKRTGNNKELLLIEMISEIKKNITT